MLEIKRYSREKIYHGCLVQIEKSIPRNHCLAPFSKASCCQTVTLRRIFLSAPMKDSYNLILPKYGRKVKVLKLRSRQFNSTLIYLLEVHHTDSVSHTHKRIAKAQINLHICTVLPQPWLFPHSIMVIVYFNW